MQVFELTYPGTWLDLPNNENAFKLNGQLQMSEGHFTDAVVAFNLFVGERSRGAAIPSRETWEHDNQRRQELIAEFQQSLSARIPLAALEVDLYRQVYEHADIQLKRERWAAGVLPTQYQMRPAFLHARSFIYGLDNLGRALKVLSRETGVPTGLRAHVDTFYSAFPSLVGVRDTAHHPENRGRGLDKRGNPLKLKPVQNAMISAPAGGALILDALNGNSYGCTMTDGHYGEVEVSDVSLTAAQSCMQAVLNEFSWTGPSRHTPY